MSPPASKSTGRFCSFTVPSGWSERGFSPRLFSSITYIEKEQSYGRLDCVVETAQHVYIFEFKLDGKAAEALAQINERGYATEYLSSGKSIHKVGVSVSSETATVDDWGVEE